MSHHHAWNTILNIESNSPGLSLSLSISHEMAKILNHNQIEQYYSYLVFWIGKHIQEKTYKVLWKFIFKCPKDELFQ